mmetsp:Transcript_78049/g.181019  ORF Transcript_78049/g.181019 Transcript_78049/m.181019 type:complete len:200 (+) Transcript_78049:73-672(+)|eukprot:CAMPEP_0171082758 /NCGR_PEP_ID=MMETSP0766_2-20121228/17309_1 /TAXON_ID=439317 /ORGANISM="Gambierdiscus australes, Strain CAWD 149" /LENGTH=199 /DNA_ID=CAMNT_0011540149 /DNA_START=1 /DNA_END=600 /DNA_ORIENTATION=+
MGQLAGASLMEGDMELVEDGGLRSSTFEVPPDLDGIDSCRLELGMVEVRQVMQREGLSFDEARLKLVLARMEQMNVDATGMPNDPKTFTFDQLGGTTAKPWRSHGSGAARRWTDSAVAELACAEHAPKGMRGPACLDWLGSCPANGAAKVAKPSRGSPQRFLFRASALLVLGVLIFILRALDGWSHGALPPVLVQPHMG